METGDKVAVLTGVICSSALILALLIRFVVVPKASVWMGNDEKERMRPSDIGHV